jgi:hypothetical protein
MEPSLADLTAPAKRVALVGLAKNTGKTQSHRFDSAKLRSRLREAISGISVLDVQSSRRRRAS